MTAPKKAITAAVRRYIRSLGTLEGPAKLSADLAIELAKSIDAGVASTPPRLTAIAVANRELRATLAEIAGNDTTGRDFLASLFQPRDAA
jgi:hypothetical protein